MENSRLREAASTAINVTVGKRSREYLTDREVERLIEAAKQNRSGHRDATAILVAYRHGLRASELLALLGRHRPRHRALACAQGQERRCQRASDIGTGKPRAAQPPARSPNVPIRLHLGAGTEARG
jgi:site-specific recombinase XerD